MTELCDMHCHILPGVDDGAKTMEEALHVMREASRQQIGEMIVTPHFHPGRYRVYAEQVYDSVMELRRQCQLAGIDVMLYPGQECYYFTGMAEALDRREILTLAGSRYVLTEFSPDCPYSYLRNGLRELQIHGYHPILAHFERYSCLREKEHLFQVKEQGILLQMNFDTLLQREFFFHKNPWRQMVKEGLVDYLGSDCHGMDFRPLHVYEAYQWVLRNVDTEIRNRMFVQNINKIIKRAKDR